MCELPDLAAPWDYFFFLKLEKMGQRSEKVALDGHFHEIDRFCYQKSIESIENRC